MRLPLMQVTCTCTAASALDKSECRCEGNQLLRRRSLLARRSCVSSQFISHMAPAQALQLDAVGNFEHHWLELHLVTWSCLEISA